LRLLLFLNKKSHPSSIRDEIFSRGTTLLAARYQPANGHSSLFL